MVLQLAALVALCPHLAGGAPPGCGGGAEELDRVLGGDLHLARPAQTKVGQAVPVCSNTVISNQDIDNVMNIKFT